MKIEINRLLDEIDDAAWALTDRSMQDDATLADVTAAALAVRVAGMLRRKVGASSQAHEDIEAEFLVGLSLRLMELDGGHDLTGAIVAANAISPPKPVAED